jgi:hypothetical protein
MFDLKLINLFTLLIFCVIIVSLAIRERLDFGAAHPVLVFGAVASVFAIAFSISSIADHFKRRR